MALLVYHFFFLKKHSTSHGKLSRGIACRYDLNHAGQENALNPSFTRTMRPGLGWHHSQSGTGLAQGAARLHQAEAHPYFWVALVEPLFRRQPGVTPDQQPANLRGYRSATIWSRCINFLTRVFLCCGHVIELYM
jgi:hypothetical protein